jgi:hypothetical protein
MRRCRDVRPSVRHLAPFLAGLLIFLAIAPLLAQEEETEGAQADTTAAAGGEEEEEGPSLLGQLLRGGRTPAEFHPKYTLSHTRDQDVSAWKHGFNVAYPLSNRIAFRASSNINIRTNEVQDRTNRQEVWNAGLDVAVSSAITTGLTFSRNDQVDVRYEGKPNEVRSFRQKDAFNLVTGYSKTYLHGIGVQLGAAGGFEKNEYSDVRSRGSTQRIDASIKYDAPLGLSTGFTYGGTHSLLDSEQGSLRSKDESFDHRLSGDIQYEWEGSTFDVSMLRGISRKEYPKEEQTERRKNESESVGLDTDLALVRGLTTRIGLSYDRTSASYLLEPSKDNDVTSRAVSASLTYDMEKTKFTAELRSDTKRNNYFDAQTGTIYTNSVGGALTHDFGAKFTATVRGKTTLLSHHYDDIEANDQDRDLFDQEAGLDVSYTPRKDIQTSLALRIKEDELVYIRTTRSGDNKTTQTYSVQPSISKTFGPRVSVAQQYELSADYTFYSYNHDANFLIRNFAVTTSLRWSPLGAVKLSIDHKYRAQDEGSYVEDEFGVDRYSKSSERYDQSMGLGLKYRLFGMIDLSVDQDLAFQRRWVISGDVRRLSWEKFDTRLTGQASADYTLSDGTVLKFSVGRTHRDATNILERQKQVWNISLDINKTF